jgi:hypothetical protein
MAMIKKIRITLIDGKVIDKDLMLFRENDSDSERLIEPIKIKGHYFYLFVKLLLLITLIAQR